MYANLKAKLIAKYYLRENKIVGKSFDMQAYVEYLREYSTPESQIAISPPFKVSNSARETPTVPNPDWRSIHETVERKYWKKLGVKYLRRSKDHEFWNTEPSNIKTLQEMIYDRFSWVQSVYEPVIDENGKKLFRVVNTSNKFPLEKQLKLYREFNVNTAFRGLREEHMWDLVPGALKWMNFQMDNEKNFGTVTFCYDPKNLCRRVRIYTSAGINGGGIVLGTYRGMKVKVVSSGKKIFCMEQAMRTVHDILTKIRKDDRDYANVITAVIKAKTEWKLGQFKTIPQLREMLMKMREFFIPSMYHNYIGILCNEQRMLFERNNIIRIGMKWWHGGAELVYKFLNGDLPDMVWIDGDITGLDKHIQDWMLLLYCANAYPYFKWDSMSAADSKFLKNLLIFWASNVCCKLVCHVGGFWRFMAGQMYSGGKETSHGDSWIMAFLFYCYCEHIKRSHPRFADRIEKFMSWMIIVIIVYGDDHIWCAPKILSHIMNHNTWRDFLKDYCGMELRDANIYTSLLSEPDHTGRLKVRGPRFLKRHIIRNTDPEIKVAFVPYKEIDEIMLKSFALETHWAPEVKLIVTGMAWDTMFTNRPAYDALRVYYNIMEKFDVRTPAQIYAEMDKTKFDSYRIRRLFKKIGMSASEFDQFPEWDVEKRRHDFNMVKASHIVDPKDVYENREEYEYDEEDCGDGDIFD
jgi:hypothetical protein